MIEKITKFFIENSKLTFVLVLSTFLVWILSYINLPKQYNPEIIVPTFDIWVSAPWLNSSEVNKYIVSPLENKIMELEWIDEVFWYSKENFAWVMAKFDVWVDKEEAKIRINQKLNENLDLKPFWVWDPVIKSIDPDELSQITYAIYIKDENTQNLETNYIYLRQIANIIKEELKTLDNITTIDIVWWYKKDLIIDINFSKLDALNISLDTIYNSLKNNNNNLPIWDLNLKDNSKIILELDWYIDDLEKIKKYPIFYKDSKTIYLEDVSNIRYGISKLDKYSFINSKEAVFIWFWKKIWSNGVLFTSDIKDKIEDIKKTLPKDIELKIIQDEWETAREATSMLIINLFQSIAIVLVVLTLFLWFKSALNTAISIPLTLFSVFIISIIIWENINRITLFALILVLWMLVDDSTVVVENINRHLSLRKQNWKTKLRAILDAVGEVKLWVILSTVTRLLAFGSMFFVAWMMWEYMWPIPKFALIASIISTIVSLTINPWISYYLHSDKENKKTTLEEKKDLEIEKSLEKNSKRKKNKVLSIKNILDKFSKRPSIRKAYLIVIWLFLWDEKIKIKRRKLFRLFFVLSLILVILAPIYFWIFKARMLPKSNQDQFYIWIDWPKSWSVDKTLRVQKDLDNYLFKNESYIIDSLSSTVWQAFIWDFANLFRWWNQRTWENQISYRINLISKKDYKNLHLSDRISSEKYVIELRWKLEDYLLNLYPDLKISILEDPPWPPVKSTFMAKVTSDSKDESLIRFFEKVEKEVFDIWLKNWLVDINDNLNSNYKKLSLKIDYDSLIKNNLSVWELYNSLKIFSNPIEIGIYKDKDSLESSNIFLYTLENNDISLENIFVINSFWKKIYLDSLVFRDYEFIKSDIETINREKSYNIYWEVWANSLVYPQISIFKRLLSSDFLWDEFALESWNPYAINYIWLNDGKSYSVEFLWEWELTMDTFKDLWIAMFIALLWIYFILVWQFKSFRVSGIIMISFLLWFFWVFPWFSFLYLVFWEYFSATSMIWVIALAWIVVWNSIILVEYLNIEKRNGLLLKDALLRATYTRFKPIVLTSLTTVFWAMTIIWDPVWSWLAWSIIFWLSISAILTLLVIPIFYYDSQKKYWD